MPITYHPDETIKMKRHVVEQLQQPNILYSFSGTHDLSSGSMNVGVWCPSSWEIRRVSIHFNADTSKNYAVSVMRGVGIIKGKNDRLWVKVDGAPSQAAIITQGFYDGGDLATAVAAALNACAFPAASKPFAVAYDEEAGTFTIEPAAGNAKVLLSNYPSVTVKMNSTAAPLLGFTANTAMDASLVSDTPVSGLGTMTTYVTGTSSATENIMSTDVVAMTVDNQLVIEASLPGEGDLLATYEVVYKTLDA